MIKQALLLFIGSGAVAGTSGGVIGSQTGKSKDKNNLEIEWKKL